MMFACVVLVAAVASIDVAAVHVHAGETTLTRRISSNNSTMNESDDNLKNGASSIIDNASTLDKNIGTKLRLVVGILNKLVEKKKNMTTSFIKLFVKFKNSTKSLPAARTFTLNNTPKNGYTESSSSVDAMSVSNDISETSKQSRPRKTSDANEIPSPVVLDNGLNVTSIRDLLSNTQENDTALHRLDPQISPKVRPLLFEFDGDSVIRQKIESHEEEEEEDGENYDEDTPTLISQLSSKQSSFERSSENDSPLNLLPDQNWSSDFPLTDMTSRILFEDEKPSNHIPIHQIQPVQRIQTSGVRRNKQELNLQGTSSKNPPQTFHASSLQRGVNLNEEILLLENFIKFAGLPKNDNKAVSSIQNENYLFDDSSLLNILQGDSVDKKSESGQNKESEENIDFGRGIENERVVRTDVLMTGRNRSPRVSRPPTSDILAALLADTKPKVSVRKLNHNQRIQGKDSDEETGHKVTTPFEETFSNEDHSIEDIKRMHQDDDLGKYHKLKNTADRNSQEGDSTNYRNVFSGSNIEQDSGAGSVSENDDLSKQKHQPESIETSGEGISGEELKYFNRKSGGGIPESTEQTSSEENLYQKLKNLGGKNSDVSYEKSNSRSDDNDEQNSKEIKISASSEETSASDQQDLSSESSGSGAVKDKASSEEIENDKSSTENSDSSEENSDSSEEDIFVKLQPVVRNMQDRKSVLQPKKPSLHFLPHNYQLLHKLEDNAPIPLDSRQIHSYESDADDSREIYDSRDFSYSDDDIFGTLNLQHPIRNDDDLIRATSKISSERSIPKNIHGQFRKIETNRKPIYDINYNGGQMYTQYPGSTGYGTRQGYIWSSTRGYDNDCMTRQNYKYFTDTDDQSPTQTLSGYGSSQLLKLTEKELADLNCIYWATRYRTRSDYHDYGARRKHTKYFTDTDNLSPTYTLSRFSKHQLLKLTEKELADLNSIYWATRYRTPTRYTHHYQGVASGYEEQNSKEQSNIFYLNMGRHRRMYKKRYYGALRMLTHGRFGTERRSSDHFA